MTLTRLVLAWLPVAVWFVAVEWGSAQVARRAAPSSPAADLSAGADAAALRPAVVGRVVEAGVVALVASLWFDSLGAGEWWLLFLLLGALVAVAAAVARRPAPAGRALYVLGAIDAVRYVAAGAILAWRLG